MKIGIDGSRAFLKQRTGIEEYSYQIIKNLRGKLFQHQIILYLRKNQKIDFSLPKNWQIKKIKFPIFWTQIGLSLIMIFQKVEILFVPAHTLPFIHPKKSIVVIHGLEYEIIPEAYRLRERLYMRLSIKKSCQWAKKIIAVSQNTKKDLIKLYNIPESKIEVIYEGVNNNFSLSNNQNNFQKWKPFFLFIGRIEKRKNIQGLIRAFNYLKKQYKLSHRLVLAGGSGVGYEEIKSQIEESSYQKDIILTGFIAEKEKANLISQAEIFLFPTFYEGFGLPILEAQSLKVPVVTSNISSMPEISQASALLVDPYKPMTIAQAIHFLLINPNKKEELIRKGLENVKRFSWGKSSLVIAKLIMKQ